MRITELLRPSFYRKVYRKINDRLLIRLNPDYARIRGIQQHLDIISLGSNPGKYAIDFSSTDVKGHNLAVGPQTLEYDFRMLKNYHSFLDGKGPAVVLLVLCPFSLCKFRYSEKDGNVSKDVRYYPILHHSQINGYDPGVYRRWKKNTLIQVLSAPGLIKKALRGRDVRHTMSSNPLSETSMEASAENYIAGWRREFELPDLEGTTLSAVVDDALARNSAILDEVMDFCRERDLTPVVVLPPISRHLLVRIPKAFRERCLHSLLNGKPIRVLDYMEAEDWKSDENFVDALCLNRTGRKKFTEEIIRRLREEKILDR